VNDPRPASVADHEASHAVVWWWWWRSTPEGRDPGTGTRFFRVTIEPDEGREGDFDPLYPSFGTSQEKDDLLCLAHVCAMGLAGPISDELRNEEPRHSTDEYKVEKLASICLPSTAEASSFLEDLRPRVRSFLERPDVRAMVGGLAEALLEHKTLGHKEAVDAMKDARASFLEGQEPPRPKNEGV
jgi:hypothetical protein